MYCITLMLHKYPTKQEVLVQRVKSQELLFQVHYAVHVQLQNQPLASALINHMRAIFCFSAFTPKILIL